MIRFFALVAVTMAMLSPTRAEVLPISMVYSNSSSVALPMELFSKGRWQPDPEASYVKLHLYFDRPVKLSRFEVISCDKPLQYGISAFANFDEWLWKLDEDAVQPEPLGSENKNRTTQGEVDGETKVRSLTFNFERNAGFALCGLKLYDQAGKPFDIVVPKIVGGKAAASSTLEPSSAYDVINLFDSRFESAWASNHQATKVDLKFDFDQPQTITKLRIWSGYQRSPEHCIANSRPKTLRIDGEGGYTAKLTVQDALGAQELALPKPYSGKTLKITVEDSFRGKAYADLVISELRFGNSGGWFMLDPLPHIRASVAENRNQFREANLSAALDSSMSGTASESLFRLRSDGSFYLQGRRGTQSEGDMDFFAIGNYEIKGKDAVKGLQLRLFGLYYEKAAYGDCNGCGRDCNRAYADKEKIFQELVWLKTDDKGNIVMSSVNGKRLSKVPKVFAPENQSRKKMNGSV